MTYHIARGGQQIGVFAEEEIRSGLGTGRFQAGDLCWTDGMADWQTVRATIGAAAVSPGLAPPVSQMNPYAAPQSQVLSNLPGLTPASRLSRLGACLLDVLSGVVGICVPIGLGMFIMVKMERSGSDEVPTAALVSFGLAGLALLGLTIWNIVLLATRGQTLGKKWLGIRIVTFPDGQKPGFVKAFLVRSFVNGIIGQVVPFYGLVDACFIFREDNRCVHDLLAETTVIEGHPPEA